MTCHKCKCIKTVPTYPNCSQGMHAVWPARDLWLFITMSLGRLMRTKGNLLWKWYWPLWLDSHPILWLYNIDCFLNWKWKSFFRAWKSHGKWPKICKVTEKSWKMDSSFPGLEVLEKPMFYFCWLLSHGKVMENENVAPQQ